MVTILCLLPDEREDEAAHAGEAFRDSREGVQPPLVAGKSLSCVDAACVDEEGNDVDTPPFLLKIK